MWTPCFIVMMLVFGAIGMSETDKATLIRRAKTPAQFEAELEVKRQQALERIEKNLPPPPKERKFKFSAANTFLDPFRMLARQPRHLLASVHSALLYAIVFVLPTVLPNQFLKAYNLAYNGRGYVFVGMIVGLVLALGVAFLTDRYVQQPRIRKWDDAHQEIKQEVGEQGLGDDSPVRQSWRQSMLGQNRSASDARDSQITSARNSNLTVTPSPMESTDGATRPSLQNLAHRNSYGSRGSRRKTMQAFSERKINIAIAIARFLNAQPANAEKKVIVEHVMSLLTDMDSFTEIIAALHNLGLEFEEALLAKVVEDAMANGKGNGDIAVERSRSLHQLATQAALMGPTDDGDEVQTPTSMRKGSFTDEKAEPESPTDQTSGGDMIKSSDPFPLRVGAPAEWRFIPALPATLLFPASLFFIAWTVNKGIATIIPVIGMGLFGFSATTLACSSVAFDMELFSAASIARFTTTEARGEQDQAHAIRAGSVFLTFLLVGVFALFAVPMYAALGFEIATTVLGAIALAAGIVPWLIVFLGPKLYGRQLEPLVIVAPPREPSMQQRSGQGEFSASRSASFSTRGLQPMRSASISEV